MPQTNETTCRARKAAGFTLVELMVVMLIIALLASILVPSVNNARTAAKTASSKSTIFVLEQAVNMFRSDETLGKDYPPSRYVVAGPDDDPYGDNGYTAWGAQTLVWATVGARLDGTRRFEAPLGETYDNNPGVGPFVDPSKLEIVKPRDPKCKVPDPWPGMVHDAAPVILDAFGMPVLYYKPDTGTTDADPIHDRLPQIDNYGFAGNDSTPRNYSDIETEGNFDDHFLDTRAEEFGSNDRPWNYDSFVLIGAGADKTYGTADDTENFKRP